MLVISKSELKKLLDIRFGDAINLSSIVNLYEKYGDEYYEEHGVARWELVKENKERIKLIQSYEGD